MSPDPTPDVSLLPVVTTAPARFWRFIPRRQTPSRQSRLTESSPIPFLKGTLAFTSCPAERSSTHRQASAIAAAAASLGSVIPRPISLSPDRKRGVDECRNRNKQDEGDVR